MSSRGVANWIRYILYGCLFCLPAVAQYITQQLFTIGRPLILSSYAVQLPEYADTFEKSAINLLQFPELIENNGAPMVVLAR